MSKKDEPKRRQPLERAETAAHRIAELVQSEMPEGWVFLLLLGSIGEGGHATYISTCLREDAILMMKETIARWERGDPEL